MMFAILGRAGCGRHDLMKALEEQGLYVAKSVTNRPKKTENEDTHEFLTQAEIDAIPADDKMLRTVVAGNEFFYRRDEVVNADVISVNPEGLLALAKMVPSEIIHVIHITADDMERKFYAVRTADDKLKQETLFDDRDMAEDQMFCDMETMLADLHAANPELTKNITCVMTWENGYQENSAKSYSVFVMSEWRKYNRLLGMVKEGMTILDILFSQDGKIAVQYKPVDGKPARTEYVTPGEFTDILRADNEGLAEFVMAYIGASQRFEDLD